MNEKNIVNGIEDRWVKEQRKTTLTKGVWHEIDEANKKNGFKDLKHMLTVYAKVGNAETMIDQRRSMKFRIDCAHLQTIANKINAGIEKEENINAFVMEMNRICAELK